MIMSKYKLFYLDDERDGLTQPIKKKLEFNQSIEVEIYKPISFEDELDRLSNKLGNFDALILDLQLNDVQEDTGERVRYQAPPLAQMLRTLATEGQIKDLPIILCSTEDRVKVSFNRDFTSHDLFDWTFLKSDLNKETPKKIISIIDAYNTIKESKNDYSSILNIDYDLIDERILSRFLAEDNSPVHEISRVIFKDIVQQTGVLINEDTLAARLGIDKKKCQDEWGKLLSKYFSEAEYSGVFKDSWKRWWNNGVIDTFEKITNENLASLDADIRVALIIEKTEFKNLIPAKPLEFYESTNFWNICEITKMPLDPFEGLKVNGKEEPKPWLDYSYVSLFGYVTEPAIVKKRGIKIHSSDIERFKTERAKID